MQINFFPLLLLSPSLSLFPLHWPLTPFPLTSPPSSSFSSFYTLSLHFCQFFHLYLVPVMLQNMKRRVTGSASDFCFPLACCFSSPSPYSIQQLSRKCSCKIDLKKQKNVQELVSSSSRIKIPLSCSPALFGFHPRLPNHAITLIILMSWSDPRLLILPMLIII